MPDARLAVPGDLAFVQDTTLAAYSAYLPVLGALPLPVDADHAAAIAQRQAGGPAAARARPSARPPSIDSSRSPSGSKSMPRASAIGHGGA